MLVATWEVYNQRRVFGGKPDPIIPSVCVYACILNFCSVTACKDQTGDCFKIILIGLPLKKDVKICVGNMKTTAVPARVAVVESLAQSIYVIAINLIGRLDFLPSVSYFFFMAI